MTGIKTAFYRLSSIGHAPSKNARAIPAQFVITTLHDEDIRITFASTPSPSAPDFGESSEKQLCLRVIKHLPSRSKSLQITYPGQIPFRKVEHGKANSKKPESTKSQLCHRRLGRIMRISISRSEEWHQAKEPFRSFEQRRHRPSVSSSSSSSSY